MRFEVVVIGAGPAGLSAAAELAQHGRSCLLLDRGPLAAHRNRGDPADIPSGVGGAGLFSDGKHSFFPSATALWQLPDRAALGAAFDATAAVLHRHGVESTPPSSTRMDLSGDRWIEKHYPALYVPFAERLACIDALWSACPDRFAEVSLVDAERSGEIVLHVDRAGRCEEIQTRELIIATGRWSPPALRPLLDKLGVRYAFRRTEIGVRIETPADHPLFARLPGVDGKLVLRAGDRELRTFCTCRDGEVVLAEADGLRAFSGRADCAPTGRSNVGLVVRGRFADALERAREAEPIRFALSAWLAEPALLVPVYGVDGAAALHDAITRLCAWRPELREATIHAPAIEGVGDYPIADGSLRIADHVWIAGDASGQFRGIVASMVSGRYVARQLLAQ